MQTGIQQKPGNVLRRNFIVSQDIHRRTCLVPEREPAPLLPTPPSLIKSHRGDHILAGWYSLRLQCRIFPADKGFLLRIILCRNQKLLNVVMFPHNSMLQSYYKQGALRYKCFIAMFHYLQYRSLCPWVPPKCRPFETEKLHDGNSTAKHGCALCSHCSASSLVPNANKCAALPGHLEQPGNA